MLSLLCPSKSRLILFLSILLFVSCQKSEDGSNRIIVDHESLGATGRNKITIENPQVVTEKKDPYEEMCSKPNVLKIDVVSIKKFHKDQDKFMNDWRSASRGHKAMNAIYVEDVCSGNLDLSTDSILSKCSSWRIMNVFDLDCTDNYRISDNYHQYVYEPLKKFIFGQDEALDQIRNTNMQRLASINPLTGELKITRDTKNNKDTEYSRPIVFHFIGDNGNGKSMTVQTYTELMYKSYHGKEVREAVLYIDGLDYRSPETYDLSISGEQNERRKKEIEKIREGHANRLIKKLRSTVCNHVKKYPTNGIIVVEEIQKMMSPVFVSLETLFYGSIECHPEHLIEESELKKIMQTIYKSKSSESGAMGSVSDQIISNQGIDLLYEKANKPQTPETDISNNKYDFINPYNRQYKIKTSDIIVILTSDLGKEDITRNKTDEEFNSIIHERIKTYTGIDNFNKYIRHIKFKPLERDSIEKILEREIYKIFFRESVMFGTQLSRQYFNNRNYNLYIQFMNYEQKSKILRYLSGVWYDHDHLRKKNGRSVNDMITTYIHPIIMDSTKKLEETIYSIKEVYTSSFSDNCPQKAIIQFFFDENINNIRTIIYMPFDNK